VGELVSTFFSLMNLVLTLGVVFWVPSRDIHFPSQEQVDE
jgi:hypothetical protein